MASSSSGPSTSSDRNFHLVLPDGWVKNDPSTKENEPLPKRKQLSLRKSQESSGRDELARQTFLSLEEERALADKCIPKNTAMGCPRVTKTSVSPTHLYRCFLASYGERVASSWAEARSP